MSCSRECKWEMSGGIISKMNQSDIKHHQSPRDRTSPKLSINSKTTQIDWIHSQESQAVLLFFFSQSIFFLYFILRLINKCILRYTGMQSTEICSNNYNLQLMTQRSKRDNHDLKLKAILILNVTQVMLCVRLCILLTLDFIYFIIWCKFRWLQLHSVNRDCGWLWPTNAKLTSFHTFPGL